MEKADKPLMIACGILEKEIDRLLELGEIDVAVHYLSKRLHTDYNRLQEALSGVLIKWLPKVPAGIVVVYGDVCLGFNGEMQALVEKHGVVKVDGWRMRKMWLSRPIWEVAGVDFMVVEEGGAAGISPRIFGRLLLPNLQAIFAEKPCPMAISFIGGTDQFLDFLLACDPDGVGIDRQCDTVGAREKIPAALPLFTGCGPHDMLANASLETIARTVCRRLDRGATAVGPPADIYPPAKMEKITAFIRAVQRIPPTRQRLRIERISLSFKERK